MAEGLYIYERQSEYWTSTQVEEFFGDLGYEVLTFPLSQLTEKHVPTDFIFFDPATSKLFGFQYKALHHNGMDFWEIDQRQHNRLQRWPWIYYCLCEIRNVRDRRSSLHLSRIVRPTFEYQKRLEVRRKDQDPIYMRWGGFYQGLVQCRYGVRVHSREHLMQLITPPGSNVGLRELQNLLVEPILIELDRRRMIRFSPLLALPAPGAASD